MCLNNFQLSLNFGSNSNVSSQHQAKNVFIKLKMFLTIRRKTAKQKTRRTGCHSTLLCTVFNSVKVHSATWVKCAHGISTVHQGAIYSALAKEMNKINQKLTDRVYIQVIQRLKNNCNPHLVATMHNAPKGSNFQQLPQQEPNPK